MSRGFRLGGAGAATEPLQKYLIRNGVIQNGYMPSGAPYTQQSGYLSVSPGLGTENFNLTPSTDVSKYTRCCARVRRTGGRNIDITVSPFGYATGNTPLNAITVIDYSFNGPIATRVAVGTSNGNTFDIFDVWFE